VPEVSGISVNINPPQIGFSKNAVMTRVLELGH